MLHQNRFGMIISDEDDNSSEEEAAENSHSASVATASPGCRRHLQQQLPLPR